MRFLVPVALFVVLVAVLAIGLKLDPRYVPSPLINKAAPEFRLETLDDPAVKLGKQDLKGRPVLLNVWSSWCGACRVEHPLLLDIAQHEHVEIIGLNYKDSREEGRALLKERGNPYRQNLFDPEGKLGLDLGVYGVPETFLLDSEGVIRFKQVGPITPEAWQNTLKPMLIKLGAKLGPAP